VSRRAPFAAWWLSALVLSACGEREEAPGGPPVPFNKIPPTLPRRVRERTLAEWLERAQSPDAARRAEAPWALVELAPDPQTIAPALERLLADPSPHVRYAAAVAVGRTADDLGPAVTRRLVAQLGAPEPGLASAVRASLTSLGARAVPALIERLGDDDLERVRLVLRSLGEIGTAAAPATPAVLGLYAGRPDLQGQAVWTLERFGPSIAPALVERLPAAVDDVAAVVLRLVPATPEVLAAHAEALLAAFRRPGIVRRAASDLFLVAGLGALPILDRLAQDPDRDLAAAATTLAEQIRAAHPR
jgi:plasmid stabilization system protein ParE